MIRRGIMLNAAIQRVSRSTMIGGAGIAMALLLKRCDPAIDPAALLPLQRALLEEFDMSEEKLPVDMTRHQRPYLRGPKSRANLEAEFARELPGVSVPGQGEERYRKMEELLYAHQTRRRNLHDAEDAAQSAAATAAGAEKGPADQGA
jgi:hypothetical protein